MKGKIFQTALMLALFTVTLGLGGLTTNAQDDRVGFEISFHHVGISVPNAEESAAWYHKMLGFEVVTKMNQGSMVVVHIRRGNCYIELFQVAGAKPLPDYRRDPTAYVRVPGFGVVGLDPYAVDRLDHAEHSLQHLVLRKVLLHVLVGKGISLLPQLFRGEGHVTGFDRIQAEFVFRERGEFGPVAAGERQGLLREIV